MTSVVPDDHADQHLRSLTLLLNLEYLQAEFYSRALDGEGLAPEERGVGAGPVLGGRRVEFGNPLVAAFVKSCAQEERRHIAILQDIFAGLGLAPVPAPMIDLRQSFATLARHAGIAQHHQVFDAFINDTNLLLASYMFEDVAMTAYQGALSTMIDATHRASLAAIASAEAGQSAVVRLMLLSAGLSDETNAISVVRQRLCGLVGTPFQGSDHGVGTLEDPSVLAVDGRSLAWGRTTAQCLAILYGNAEGAVGLFFPVGINTLAEETRQPYTPVHLASLSDLVPEDPPANVLQVFASERVDLPDIRWDTTKLEYFSEGVEVLSASAPDHYWSMVPRVLELQSALIVGAVGIVAVRDFVIEETLWHTDPQRHFYERIDNLVTIRNSEPEVLSGTTISILAGATESYWHSLIDAALRLVTIDETVWQRTSRLLIPSTGVRQDDLVALYGIPDRVEIRSVSPNEVFRAETLILPSSLHNVFDFHPSLTNAFFDRLRERAGQAPSAPARRIVVDRRGSSLRKLVCEDALIGALPGFEPVQLESLSIEAQIHLFAGADIIVAPHGAGLTNIGFARPGTIIVELMMDTYRNWCFRRLAAARGLTYFCVLGRSLDGPKAAESVHVQTWTIEIADVRVAVEQAEQLSTARPS